MGWRTLLKRAAWRGERLHRSVPEESLTILKELQTGREGWTLMYVRTFSPRVVCNLARLFLCVFLYKRNEWGARQRNTSRRTSHGLKENKTPGCSRGRETLAALYSIKQTVEQQEMKRFQTRWRVSGYGGYLGINTVAMVIHSLVISLYPLAFGMKTFLNKSPSRTTFSEWSPDSCLCVRLQLKQKNASPTRTLIADMSVLTFTWSPGWNRKQQNYY